MNMRQTRAYTLDEITFFVRFNHNGRAMSLRLSAKAFGYYGHFGHFSTASDQIEVDALAIEVDNMTSLKEFAKFHSIGGTSVSDVFFSEAKSVTEGAGVFKQSKNFENPVAGKVFTLKKRKVFNDRLMFNHSSMLPVIWDDDKYADGCSGSAICSRDRNNSLELHGFTHSVYRKCVFGVHAKSCLDAINSTFRNMNLTVDYNNGSTSSTRNREVVPATAGQGDEARCEETALAVTQLPSPHLTKPSVSDASDVTAALLCDSVLARRVTDPGVCEDEMSDSGLVDDLSFSLWNSQSTPCSCGTPQKCRKCGRCFHDGCAPDRCSRLQK